MAATATSRRSSMPANEDYLPSKPETGGQPGVIRAPSTRRRQQSVDIKGPGIDFRDRDYFPPVAPEAPQAPPASYRWDSFPHYGNNGTRSFSARSRPPALDSTYAPVDDDIYKRDRSYVDTGFDKIPPSNRQSQSRRSVTQPSPAAYSAAGTTSSYPPVPSQTARRSSDVAAAPVGSGSHGSPLSRSSTVRSAAIGKTERKDFAPDRSPLQQLESKLTGYSKEEKRARVLEAEIRVKEEIARREREKARKGDFQESPSQPDAPRNLSGIPRESTKRAFESQNRPSNYTQSRDSASGPPQNMYVQPADYQRTASQKYSVRRPENERPNRQLEESQFAAVHPPSNASQYPPTRANWPTDGRLERPAQPPTHSKRDPTERRLYQNEDRRQSEALGDEVGAGMSSKSRGPRPPEMQSTHEQQYRDIQGSSDAPVLPANTSQSRPKGYIIDPGRRPSQNRVLQLLGGAQRAFSNEPGSTQPVEETTEKKMKPRPTVSFDMPPPTPAPLDEWRNAPVGRLRLPDENSESFDVDKGKAWWEGGGSSNRRQSRALPNDYRKEPPKVNETDRFEPPLFLKCGPLLRYTGIKRTTVERPDGSVEQEFWRGSIMIATADGQSSYQPGPTLRLFVQHMDLLPPPPLQISDSDDEHLAPEYVDPTAGLEKIGRDGRRLYVKPVDHLAEAIDLSQLENDDGLFEQSPSPSDHTTGGVGQSMPGNRIHANDGEKTGHYEEIRGFRLYSDSARGVTFWRFNIEIELSETQQRIAYRLNDGPAIGFWVPGKGQAMNIMFHTSNGFDVSIDPNKFSGPDPLWRDVLNEHQTRPFHVMIGGGAQIYNDSIMVDCPRFREWSQIKNLHQKQHAPFSPDIKAEMETWFLEQYSKWFSTGLFSLANCQIPMVNIWDDHDIIDGFGSFPDAFMRAPVFSGLGNLAFKYYLLFQHQSVPAETDAEEPSWLLGAGPGPYISSRSRNLFMTLGKSVSFLGLDCRTERTRDEILSEQTYDLIWDRCHREIARGETKHLIVLVSVPIAYPRLVWLESLLKSRVMDPVKALGKAGVFSGRRNRLDGNIDIQSDLDDYWTAKNHKTERTWFIEDLQDLAAEKSVRVTILSGDVRLAAIGQFYSNPKMNLAKDKDYRYMPNVISSAIANAPPPEMLSDALNRRNKVHHMDSHTDEDMIPIFTHDVDGKTRNNKRLLPRRNWCSIREYHPGTTPPPTPPEEPPAEPEFVPGKIRRTLSLNRSNTDRPGGGLFRRLSLRGSGPPTKDFSLPGGGPERRVSISGPHPLPTETGNSYFPSGELPRPGPFLRRPTNLSQKAKISKKKTPAQGDDGVGTFVNLEGGLAITLNLEVHTGDPAGITTPYKLLVPALWYEGGYEPNATRVVKGWRKWIGQGRKKKTANESLDQLDDGGHDDDHVDDINDHRETRPEDGEYRSSDEEDPPHGQSQYQNHQNQKPNPHEYEPRSSYNPTRRPTYDEISDSEGEDEDISDEELEPRPKHKSKKWLGLI